MSINPLQAGYTFAQSLSGVGNISAPSAEPAVGGLAAPESEAAPEQGDNVQLGVPADNSFSLNQLKPGWGGMPIGPSESGSAGSIRNAPVSDGGEAPPRGPGNDMAGVPGEAGAVPPDPPIDWQPIAGVPDETGAVPPDSPIDWQPITGVPDEAGAVPPDFSIDWQPIAADPADTDANSGWLIADGGTYEPTSAPEPSLIQAYAAAEQQMQQMQAMLNQEKYEGMQPADLAPTTFSEEIPQQPLYEIFGTAGDDNITVSQNANGSLVIMVNDQQIDLPADMRERPAIFAGSGNDTVTVDKNVTVPLTILGGRGNDRITGGSGSDIIIANFGSNVIDGGAGNDVIFAHGLDLPDNGKGSIINGGDGLDYIEGGYAKDIISGGSGNDIIYGLGGDDEISGGSGKDYLDGGEGNDSIWGGDGNDNLIGGKGDDKLWGGNGGDLLIGASGNDLLSGGAAADKIISNGTGDTIVGDKADIPVETIASRELPGNIQLEGSDIELARIESDLEMLLNTDLGQELFEALDSAGKPVAIGRERGQLGSSCSNGPTASPDGDKPGPGSGSYVSYNTKVTVLPEEAEWAERAPVVSLFHELCHSYNAALGNLVDKFFRPDGTPAKDWKDGGIPGAEYQATGIPNTGVTANPPNLCENAIRKLLGHLFRGEYTTYIPKA